jgi:hypothetical protein
MKYLFTVTPMSGDGDMVECLLEKAEIPCIVRNDHLSIAAGEIPHTPPELWILNDEDYPTAKEIVDGWQNAKIETGDPWVCRCGEKIEGQFTSCWKCGRERPTRPK